MPMCGHDRQVYLEQTLPCTRTECPGYSPRAAVFIERGRHQQQSGYWFERSACKVTFHLEDGHWEPDACVARGMDSAFDAAVDAAVDAAGLGAALAPEWVVR